MKKIANIMTTNNKLDLGSAYNICRCEECIDWSLPTLIIGLEAAESHIEGFSILKKDYPEQNLYWTYKKTEKRNEHDRDLERFCRMVLERVAETSEYVYVDILNLGYTRIKNLVRYIDGEDPKSILFLKNFVFIYSEKYHKTWGISLSLCSFIGVPRNKVIERIKSNSNNIILEFRDFPSYIKKCVGDNIHWLLPLKDFV